MIEILIIEHFKSCYDLDLYLEHPKQVNDCLILIDKIGSRKNNHICTSTIAFQSYGTSLLKAAELNEKVKLAVESLVRSDEVISVTLNSDYNFTDIKTKEYRYQALFDIKHY